jgi:hypothetical protein
MFSFHFFVLQGSAILAGVEAFATKRYPEPDVYRRGRNCVGALLTFLVQQRLPESSGSNELGNGLKQ